MSGREWNKYLVLSLGLCLSPGCVAPGAGGSGTPSCTLTPSGTVVCSSNGSSTSGAGNGGSGNGGAAISAPSKLSYSVSSATYTLGTPITPDTPSSSGGAVSAYSVSPSLPSGLSLDASTGIISGTPAVLSGTTQYVVTASNSAGSTTATLSFTIQRPAPRFYGVAASSVSGGYQGFVDSCEINLIDGTLSSCVQSAAVMPVDSYGFPSGMSVAQVAGKNYAYIASNLQEGFSQGDVFVCQVSAADGSVSGCVATGGVSGWHPTFVAIEPAGTHLYAYVESGTSIYVCNVNNADGTLSSCVQSNGGIDFSSSSSWNLSFNFSGGTSYLYVISSGIQYYGGPTPTGHVYLCPLSAADGTLGACSVNDGGVSGWNPETMTMLTRGGGTYAYVGESNYNTIFVCPINGDGTFGTCTVAGTMYARSLAAVSRNGDVYVYVDTGTQVQACAVDAVDGSFDSDATCNAVTSGGYDSISIL